MTQLNPPQKTKDQNYSPHIQKQWGQTTHKHTEEQVHIHIED